MRNIISYHCLFWKKDCTNLAHLTNLILGYRIMLFKCTLIFFDEPVCPCSSKPQNIQSEITLTVSKYPDKTFGEKLRKCRLTAGLKQSELARQLGVDEMTIVNWEIGRTEPCKRYRKKISELLLVS